jgi:hypothetical protein
VRRSTAAELDSCIQLCLTEDKAMKELSKLTSVKDVVGMISVALQMEKDDTHSMTEVEEHFSKVSVRLQKLVEDDDVKQSNEAMYWIRLFTIHVNKHLQEIVLLTDSDKQVALWGV